MKKRILSQASTYLLLFVILTATVFSRHDMIAQENRDVSPTVTQGEFDRLVKASIMHLKTQELEEIPDVWHVEIMMCLNTIAMSKKNDGTGKRFDSGIYAELESLAEEKKYSSNIIKIFSEWMPNKGMGFYFPELRMELYGTPGPYAFFDVNEP